MIERIDDITLVLQDSTLDSSVEIVKEQGLAQLIIFDPPYNLSSENKGVLSTRSRESVIESFDDHFSDSFKEEDYYPMIFSFLKSAHRMLENGGSVLFFTNWKFLTDMIRIGEEVGLNFKQAIGFGKINPPLLSKRNFISSFETALWMVKGDTTKFFNYSKPDPSVYKKKCGCVSHPHYHNDISTNLFLGPVGTKRTGHICEKYDWMLRGPIKILSDEGGLVVDITAGGFNSGIVCMMLNRRYIGFEICEEYFKKGTELMKKWKDK